MARSSKLRPLFGLGQPVVRFSIGKSRTLTTHNFESVKPAFRIHRMLRNKVRAGLYLRHVESQLTIWLFSATKWWPAISQHF
jgi:hypothetical protein